MLSICIPSYNYAHYLPYAVKSCLAQNEDFELLVLDNCSSDDTPSLREKYARDPRVRWHRNDVVLPIDQNFNRAVSLGAREFVMALCADDALVPGSIRRFRQMVATKPTVCFHGFLAEIIDQYGRLLRKDRRVQRDPERRPANVEAGAQSQTAAAGAFPASHRATSTASRVGRLWAATSRTTSALISTSTCG